MPTNRLRRGDESATRPRNRRMVHKTSTRVFQAKQQLKMIIMANHKSTSPLRKDLSMMTSINYDKRLVGRGSKLALAFNGRKIEITLAKNLKPRGLWRMVGLIQYEGEKVDCNMLSSQARYADLVTSGSMS